MFWLITVLSALILVGLSVWFHIRVTALPPNARLLFNLWESLEKESVSGSRIAGKHAGHCMKGAGGSTT